MREWWEGLAARERRTVAAGLLAALAAVLVLFVVEPGLDRRAALTHQLQELVNERAWMEAQAPAVRARAGAPALAAPRAAGSPLAIVDTSARAAGLTSALRRVRPVDTAVEAELEGASYAALMGWLATLEGRHGLHITSLGIERGTEAGRVNAQIRLEPPAGRS